MFKGPLGLGLALSMTVFAFTLLVGCLTRGSMIAVASPLLLAASGACVVMLKKQRGRSPERPSAESTDRRASERASSRALRDGLVAGAVFLGAAAVFDRLPAAIPLVALVFFLMADYWIRYALQRRRPRART